MARRRWVILLAALLAGLAWICRPQLSALVTGAPRTADDHLNAGIKAYRAEEFADAIRALQQAVQVDPSRADVHYFLGQALESLGRTDEAIRQYQASLERNRDLAASQYNLAVIYRTRGNYQSAEAALKEAIRASPDFSGAHLLLGTLYFSRQDWEQALAELLAAARHPFSRREDEVGFQLMVATTYAKLGRADEALVHWRKVLSLEPENREAKEQLHALDR